MAIGRKFFRRHDPGEVPATQQGMRCAVFLERDGILNKELQNGLTLRTPCNLEEFSILDSSASPLASLRDAGLLIIATSNQPALCAGTLSRRELDLMHRLLLKRLPVDDILICPHDPSDHCPCRKPKPGLLHEAAFKWHIDLDHSFVVSKMWQDAEAAHLAGCTSVMVQSPWVGNCHHDFVVSNLQDAVAKVQFLHETNHTPHPLGEFVRS